MGLPLRNPSSFCSLTSGPAPRGGLSVTPDTDPDPDTSEPPYHRSRKLTRHLYRHAEKRTHRACKGSTCRLGLNAQCNRHRKLKSHRASRVRHHLDHQTLNLPPLAQTHHVKPHSPWAADANEGFSLARSAIRLPGEAEPAERSQHTTERRQFSRSRSTSSTTSNSSTASRPPSLERQNAFRDEKTAKRRRRGEECRWRRAPSTYHDDDCMDIDTDDAEDAQIAELYRLGVLYDDEYERGEGFSLDRILRDEPAYSLRVRPARGRGSGRRTTSDALGGGYHNVSLSGIHPTFSAFGEDGALAGWLLPSDTPRLTANHELADDAVSAASAGNFLDHVSVSDLSYCQLEEDDELVWALLDRSEVAAQARAADEDDVDPWVVLGP